MSGQSAPGASQHPGAWAVKVLARIAAGERLPLICEQNACEALAALGARHLAPAAYTALERRPWLLAAAISSGSEP